jgi:hypothetical protein
LLLFAHKKTSIKQSEIRTKQNIKGRDMKIKTHVLLVSILLFPVATCSNSNSQVASPPHAAAAPEPAAPADIAGIVAETMDAAGYTYVLLDTGREKVWFAGPGCKVKVGDKLTIKPGLEKTNFTSKTLNRTFDKLYFVESLGAASDTKAVCSASPAQSAGSSPHNLEGSSSTLEGSSRTAAPRPAGIDFAGIKKPAGGKTVEQIHAEKKALAGKHVVLRGKVVKFSPEIMGKNWAHVQDGTGAAGTADLTVTTPNTAKVGDNVLVEGIVAIDKDFGYGYKYDVLIDNATIKTE